MSILYFLDEKSNFYLPELDNPSYSQTTDFSFSYEPSMPLVSTFQPGDTINERYRVIEIIAGGVGLVYKCSDLLTQKNVALKTIIERYKRATGAYAPMSGFRKELLFRLYLPEHPNILTLRRAEYIHGYLYLVTDWQPHTLDSLKTISVKELLQYLIDIASGLHFLHLHNYVLGDLKPDNIFISGYHAMIGDFSYHASTPGYSSPEQDRNEDPDYRSDIYSFGKVMEYLWGIISKDELCTISDECILQYAAIIKKCCGGDILSPENSYYNLPVQNRYQSCIELIQTLNIIAKKCELTIKDNSSHTGTFRYDLDKVYTELVYDLKYRYSIDFGLQPIRVTGTGNSMLNMSLNQFRDPNRVVLEAESLRKKGRYQEALIKLGNPSRKTPLWYYVKGLTLLSADKSEEAIAIFLSITNPLNLRCINKGLDTLLNLPALLPNFQAHLLYLQQYFQQNPLQSDGFYPHQLLGKLYYLLGYYTIAADFFRESLCYPCTETWPILHLYGVCLYFMGHLYKAKQSFMEALEEIRTDKTYFEYVDKHMTARAIMFYLGLNDQIDILEEPECGLIENYTCKIKECNTNTWKQLYDELLNNSCLLRSAIVRADLIAALCCTISEQYIQEQKFSKALSVLLNAEKICIDYPEIEHNIAILKNRLNDK